MDSSPPRLTDTVIRGLVAAAALVVIVAGLRAGATLLVPLVVSGFVALVCYPLVGWLARRGLPQPLAVTVTLLVLLLALLGPGLVVHGAAAGFAAEAPRYGARLEQMTAAWFEWLQVRGVEAERITSVVNSAAALDLAGAVFAGLAVLLSNAFIVLIVVAFLLVEAEPLGGRAARALGLSSTAWERFGAASREVQRYLWIKTVISLATGLLVGLWTAVLGLDFAVLWGLLAFLLNYIPNFGSLLAAVPAVLLALAQFGWERALAVAAGFVVVNVALGNFVEPAVMGRRLGLSPLVVVVVLVVWGWIWGATGLLLAVPVTMVAKILLEHSTELRWIAELLGDTEPVRTEAGRPRRQAS